MRISSFLKDAAKVIAVIVVLTVALSLTTGCAGQSKIVYVDKEVLVPVSTPCKVPAIDRPDFPLDEPGAVDAEPQQQLNMLISENEMRRAYEAELEAGVQSCQ